MQRPKRTKSPSYCHFSLRTQGEGAQKNRGYHRVFYYPPPSGGTRPEKDYPPPLRKKVSQPQFFSKERHTIHLLEATGC